MDRKIRISFLALFVLIIGSGAFFFFKNRANAPTVTSIDSAPTDPLNANSGVGNFEECVAAGNPVAESYPRQCQDGDQTFTENVGNGINKSDLIRLDNPLPNQTVNSPLTIKGQARGFWFFEASFPVVLVDWDGRIIAQGTAQAKGDWMTTGFVPFEATLNFTIAEDIYSKKGALILRKDNPSGLPANDDSLEIPILYSATSTAIGGVVCTQEAKLCPDGSYVGRSGPNCEFADCPAIK